MSTTERTETAKRRMDIAEIDAFVESLNTGTREALPCESLIEAIEALPYEPGEGWRLIPSGDARYWNMTYRRDVPGGWLYMVVASTPGSTPGGASMAVVATSMAFVPDPALETQAAVHRRGRQED